MHSMQEKDIAIKIAQADGVSRASLITGISQRTIYYWLDKDAEKKDRERRRKAAEAQEAALVEAAETMSKLVDLQAEVNVLEAELEAARNTAQQLNDWIHSHYPFGHVLDLTGDSHGI